MFIQIRKWSAKCCIIGGLLWPCLYGQVSLDSMMDTTLHTWSIVDTIRAIAREDRHHLYPRLIKAHLELYANTYWFTASYKKDAIAEEFVDAIQQLFTALTTAQKDTLSGQSISDNPQATLFAWSPALEVPLQQKNIGGLFSCIIMDQTQALWNHFTNPKKS